MEGRGVVSGYLSSFVLVVWCLAPIIVFFAFLVAMALVAERLMGNRA
jgi:hypothetical protein